jgi:hypothetical protein
MESGGFRRAGEGSGRGRLLVGPPPSWGSFCQPRYMADISPR